MRREGEDPAALPAQAPAPERRMRWSFRIFREEYLRDSHVCQVEPLSKSSVLRVPETPPGSNLPYVPHAGGVSFWRMTRRSPRSPGRARLPRSFYDEQSCPPTMLSALCVRPVLALACQTRNRAGAPPFYAAGWGFLVFPPSPPPNT